MKNKWSPHNRNSSSHREIGQMAHVKVKFRNFKEKRIKYSKSLFTCLIKKQDSSDCEVNHEPLVRYLLCACFFFSCKIKMILVHLL